MPVKNHDYTQRFQTFLLARQKPFTTNELREHMECSYSTAHRALGKDYEGYCTMRPKGAAFEFIYFPPGMKLTEVWNYLDNATKRGKTRATVSKLARGVCRGKFKPFARFENVL